ncbi:MAG: TIGR01777 family oxidoreductase [Dehalococcoidia bacterium]|nr:TIGR01777 family oxidoreductase [Dehalococcoidia bacterium]
MKGDQTVRIIITGGSGLIGKSLTRSLVSGGHEVVVLSRNPARVSGLPVGARAARWDASTGEGWSQLAEDAAIVNLAGENISLGRWTSEVKQRIRESRLSAGKAVVNAVETSPSRPRVLIQASAVGYYGPRGNEELREDSPPGGDFLAQVCIDWEASTAPVEEMGVRRAVIRTSPVFAAREGVLPRMTLPFRFFVGGRLGSGRQWFPWMHVADEVAAIRFLLEHEAASGPFNLASPHTVTNAQFSRALGRAMRRPSVLPAPTLVLSLLYGEMGRSLMGSQRVIPQRLLDLGFTFRFADADAALRNLLD